ncbi:hypothetical protein ACB092_07G193800 [Castanea dentata]
MLDDHGNRIAPIRYELVSAICDSSSLSALCSQLRLAMVFKVSCVETKPIDGQKPGTSSLRKKRLVQQQLTQYSTSEELSTGKIKFKAFDLGGHQIAHRV